MIASFFNSRIWKYQVRDSLLYWFFIPAAVICAGTVFDILLNLAPFTETNTVAVPALLLLTAGSTLICQSMKDLLEYGGGTVNPLRPPRELVKQGSYRICRHPMFLGYDIAALGVVLLFCSPGMLIFSYPLLIVLEVRFLRKEEKILKIRFRDAFEDYQRQVSFLIPIHFRRTNQ